MLLRLKELRVLAAESHVRIITNIVIVTRRLNVSLRHLKSDYTIAIVNFKPEPKKRDQYKKLIIWTDQLAL